MVVRSKNSTTRLCYALPIKGYSVRNPLWRLLGLRGDSLR